MSFKIFRGRLIDAPTPKELRIRDNTYIGVKDNIIEFISETLPEEHKDKEVVQLGNGEFILPGFVDCHAHPPQYPFIGTAFGLPLLDWLKATVHNFEPKYADTEYAKKIYSKFMKKTIENGTVAGSYFATIHKDSSLILADICEQYHFKALIGKVNQDMNFPDCLRENTEESMKDTLAFIETMKTHKHVQPILTPRFAVSCTRNLMKQLGDLANEKDIFLQTHLSESVNECDLIGEMYPECDNYTDVYKKYNCLTNKTLLAHSIHLSDDELKVIKSAGSALVHCPNANLVMKSGFCPVKKALAQDVKVCMGSDVSGGCSVSMVEAMKLALIVGNINNIIKASDVTLTLAEVVYLATAGGAKCLHMDDEIGSIDVGKRFDCIRVDLESKDSPIDLFEWNTNEQMVERFILQGDSRNIVQVFIDGQIVSNKL